MSKTTIERQDYAWFALADAEHCRLLRCHLTRRGTSHVDEHDAIENTFPEHEHLRPQTGDGMTHDVEEKERRFAGEIVNWLQERAKQREIDRLVIFATSRMLGVLRKASSGLLKGHLEEVEGNLMRLEAGQLAEHPMVRDLVREARQRSLSGGRAAKSRREPKSKVGRRKRDQSVALVERKAWRAGIRVAGPAEPPRSRVGRSATTDGHTGRGGRRRGDQ
jgi:protein required for attachment to host cells